MCIHRELRRREREERRERSLTKAPSKARPSRACSSDLGRAGHEARPQQESGERSTISVVAGEVDDVIMPMKSPSALQ